MSSERALYLGAASEAVFGMLHEPDGEWGTTAVVLAPPWGWEDVASYRSRRAWAEDLAAHGHAVLRLDLPGSGDSAGSAGDPDRVGAWIAAIDAGAAMLRDRGARRVGVIGLGLSGLLAGAAVARGAPIDDLVLWAGPSRGKAFVREARAFSRLQTSYVRGASEDLPEGWLEVNGFVLAAETIAALGSLQLPALDLSGLQRALLLERDGIAVDEDLRQHLVACNVAVTTQPGTGWEAMCAHPGEFRPPRAVIAAVQEWIAAGSDASLHRPGVAPSVSLEAVVQRGVRESPFTVRGPSGDLFGILAEPVATERQPFIAVFLNAGAVRHIGPNRIWVETARRWAERGVTSLRIDVEGLGDAHGDAAGYSEVGELYRAELGVQVTAFLDALEARRGTHRFMLVGLCAGGYWGFQTAAHDPRIEAAALLNPGALVWDPALIPTRDARKLGNLGRARGWRKLVRGRVGPRRILTVARAAFASRGRDAGRTRASVAAEIEAKFEAIHDLGTRAVVAFSANEPLAAELEASGIIERLERWPNVRLVRLPGGDHTVRPIVAQRAVHELLDRELERQLSGEPVR